MGTRYDRVVGVVVDGTTGFQPRTGRCNGAVRVLGRCGHGHASEREAVACAERLPAMAEPDALATAEWVRTA